jgi:antitoxin component of RelBE/YafQ-DinJ toxin-antitoxin module
MMLSKVANKKQIPFGNYKQEGNAVCFDIVCAIP